MVGSLLNKNYYFSEINIIDEVKINEPLTTIATSESEKNLNATEPRSSSIVLNTEVLREVVPPVNTIVLLENNQSNAIEQDTINLGINRK